MNALLSATAPVPQLPTWLVALVTLLTAVGGIGGIGGLVLLLHWRKNGRKIDAEAGKAEAEGVDVIANAAVALVEPLQQRLSEVEAQVRELLAWKRDQEAVLVEHATWDEMAVAALAQAGITLPSPPPLYPRSAA